MLHACCSAVAQPVPSYYFHIITFIINICDSLLPKIDLLYDCLTISEQAYHILIYDKYYHITKYIHRK